MRSGNLRPGRFEELERRCLLAAPVGALDHFATSEDVTLNVPSIAGVLANDVDTDNEPLEAVLVSGPANGSLTLLGDGSFTFEPRFNYSGADSFVYKPWDGTTPLSAIAPVTVSLFVNAVNETPVANVDRFEVVQGEPLTVAAPGVLINDLSPDGSPLSAVLIVRPTAAVAGSFSLNSNGSFTYTPRDDFSGIDTFTYRAVDASGLAGAETTVELQVLPDNNAPTLVDDVFVTEQGEPLFVDGPGVLANDSDPEGDVLSAFVVDNPKNGTITLSGDGSFVYTPNEGFVGGDVFTYRVSDGRLPSLEKASVNVIVVAVPHAPVALGESYTTEEDERFIVPAPGLLGNDSDADADATLRAVLVNPPQRGTLTLNPDGLFVYTPLPDFTGIDTFTYRASDGTLQSELATVTISVTPIASTIAGLAAESDTGASASDRITNDTSPTFTGTTRASLVVRLFARPAGSSASPVLVGDSVADSLGNWRITSTPLADGGYEFFVAGFRPDELSTGLVSAGSLSIDSTPPVVVNAVILPRTGQIQVNLLDAGSGPVQASIRDLANFSLSRLVGPRLRARELTGMRVRQTPESPQTVTLAIEGGRVLTRGRFLFIARSGGVADIAGNALDGEFSTSTPTGDGRAGGDFIAQFSPLRGRPASALPATTSAAQIAAALGAPDAAIRKRQHPSAPVSAVKAFSFSRRRGDVARGTPGARAGRL